MKLALMVAAVPPLSVECFQRTSAFFNPIERAHAHGHGSALGKLLHGTACAFGGWWPMTCVVRVV